MIGIDLAYGSDDDDDMVIDKVKLDNNKTIDKQQEHAHEHQESENHDSKDHQQNYHQKQSLKYINEIPSAPSNELLNPITIDRMKDYIEKKEDEGFDLTASIRSKKIFGNPYILSSVVQHFGIQEYGSEYPIDKWNPAKIQEDYDEEEIKRRYNDNNNNECVQVPTIPIQQNDNNITQNFDENKRKSRWN